MAQGHSESAPKPDQKTLEEAGELEILDENGQKSTFRDLFNIEGRSVIVFIRHFFCGHCEDYVRELSKVFPPKDLARINPSTTLTIIGCGESAAIAGYKERTSTSFPIYCDPSRALYAKLGMTSSLSLGNQRPDYVKSGLIGGTLSSMATMISSGSMALKGGNYSQNGGEWVFVDGHLEWCHRMQNTRDHAEVKDLGDVLGFKMKD